MPGRARARGDLRQDVPLARVVDLVDDHVDQAGPVLLARALTPNKQGIVLEARDVHDGRPVWTKTFPAEPPAANYTVLARRYRPQQFADLVGQEPVAQALVNAIQSQRVAHAYLFTGARGVGKTSTARILAKALNCANGPTTTPCGACDLCKAIAAGEDVDVLEIDGASNRRIEEVRDIRQNVQFRPTRGRYKIYIIDEVHMLTKEAFNALLKTLEEPPPHVKFIFATTEVQKIPITILSRCQRFDFAGIASERIVDRLRAVVAVPLLAADRVLGVVAIYHPTGYRLPTEDREFLETLAAHAAVSLENARLFAETRRRQEEAETLTAITRTLTASLDLRTVLSRVAANVREMSS